MNPTKIVPPGGRRIQRPRSVKPCPKCGEALGGGYAVCANCRETIESIWLADWQALLRQEGITPGSPDEELLARVVLEEYESHPWTVVDIAMSLLKCSLCGSELGERYSDCAECGLAFGSSILAEAGATANEHALHIGRWMLRFPDRHSSNAVTGWRLTMPRILTGWLPTTAGAQRMSRRIKAGQIDQVENLLAGIDLEINQQANHE